MKDEKTLTPEEWYTRQMALRAVEALNKKGFVAFYAPSRDEAKEIALKHVPQGASVGIGGSATVRELGIHEALKASGHRVFDHWDGSLDAAGKVEARDNQITADVFLSSTNALTLGGSLVNVDGTGNRVASMIFGPKMTIIVAGINKLVRDVESGMRRIREWAAPINFKRLGREAPCTTGGDCSQCEGASTICRVTTIIDAPPGGKQKFVIIVVGEKLGY